MPRTLTSDEVSDLAEQIGESTGAKAVLIMICDGHSHTVGSAIQEDSHHEDDIGLVNDFLNRMKGN